MIHSILILSSTGVVLFHKSFTSASYNDISRSGTGRLTVSAPPSPTGHSFKTPTQLAGLFTAMLKFTSTKTSLSVSSISMSHLNVCIASNYLINSIVFCDANDTIEFGLIAAKELMFSFCRIFQLSQLSLTALQSEQFSSFSSSVLPTIINVCRVVIDKLLLNSKQINSVMLVNLSSSSSEGHLISSNDSESIFHSSQSSNSEIDRLSLLAFHRTLIQQSNELLNNNYINRITFKNWKSESIRLIRLISVRASLIICIKNDSQIDDNCRYEIEKCRLICEKVLLIAQNLQGNTRL